MPPPEGWADPRAVAARVRYKPGWSFKIAGPLGSMLCIFAETPDSWQPAKARVTQHQFPLPDAPMGERDLVRWMFEQVLLAERHEAGEFFQVDDRRPFYPHHQDEGSPYDLVERWE